MVDKNQNGAKSSASLASVWLEDYWQPTVFYTVYTCNIN